MGKPGPRPGVKYIRRSIEELKRIVVARDSGLSHKEIAIRFRFRNDDASRQIVFYARRRLGIKVRPQPPMKCRHVVKFNRMLFARACGVSFDGIAERFGYANPNVARVMLWYAKKKLNLKQEHL